MVSNRKLGPPGRVPYSSWEAIAKLLINIDLARVNCRIIATLKSQIVVRIQRLLIVFTFCLFAGAEQARGFLLLFVAFRFGLLGMLLLALGGREGRVDFLLFFGFF